jgi:hypothetical protein
MNESDWYKKVRPILKEHRSQIEEEMKKGMKGNKWPPPSLVMDKLLKLEKPVQKT